MIAKEAEKTPRNTIKYEHFPKKEKVDIKVWSTTVWALSIYYDQTHQIQVIWVYLKVHSKFVLKVMYE